MCEDIQTRPFENFHISPPPRRGTAVRLDPSRAPVEGKTDARKFVRAGRFAAVLPSAAGTPSTAARPRARSASWRSIAAPPRGCSRIAKAALSRPSRSFLFSPRRRSGPGYSRDSAARVAEVVALLSWQRAPAAERENRRRLSARSPRTAQNQYAPPPPPPTMLSPRGVRADDRVDPARRRVADPAGHGRKILRSVNKSGNVARTCTVVYGGRTANYCRFCFAALSLAKPRGPR